VATGFAGMSQTAAAKTCNCDEIEPDYKPHVSANSESVQYNYKSYTETAAILFEACKAPETGTWMIMVTLKSNSWTKATEDDRKADEGDYVGYIMDETITFTHEEINDGSVDSETYGDWVGAYKLSGGDKDPGWDDLAFRTAEYLAGWVPWVGQGYSTADYMNDMYGGFSEMQDDSDRMVRFFDHRTDDGYSSKVGSIVKYRFDMEPGASMDCQWEHELGTYHYKGDHSTSISFTVFAPDENPEDYC